MRVLVVDNYDSYTYNLCQQIARMGSVEPVVIRNDELDIAALAARVEQLGIEAVVISPGPGRPERARDFGERLRRNDPLQPQNREGLLDRVLAPLR